MSMLASLQIPVRAFSPSEVDAARATAATLQRPLPEVISVLLSTDQRATRLRQSSPFAGLLSVSERTEILKRFPTREPQPA